MHWNDGSRFPGEVREHLPLIQSESLWVNVNDNWPCSHGEYDGSGRAESKARNDDLIAMTDSEGEQSKMERTRSARGRKRGCVESLTKGFLELTFKPPVVGNKTAIYALVEVLPLVTA
jgi:hypothetical protein